MKSKVEVIFQENSLNFNLGDRVLVTRGYARNYLLPYGKAVLATSASLAEFEKRRAALEKAAEERDAQAKTRAQQLQTVSVKIPARARDEGKLFGSIGGREIADAVTQQGIALEKREVRLPQGPIRQLGEYDVSIHISKDVSATIKVIIVPEKQ